MHSQLAVLGGGPSGYAAAFLAADEGLEVTIVEAEGQLGGTCLLRGCIPSKALLHVGRVLSEVRELQTDWGIEFGSPRIRLEAIRDRKQKVIGTLAGGLKQLAKRRNVRIIHARGMLENSGTLRLQGNDPTIPEERQLTFDHLIMATGSIPAVPPAFRIDSPRVMDSTAALELQELPQRMLVIGGGYIGLELGSAYANLGCDVSVVELTDGLLPGADRDLVRPLEKHLKALFHDQIFLNTKVGSLGERAGNVEVAFEGPGKFGVEQYDRVLVSIGRRPNSDGCGLENTQVERNERGFVIVDSSQRTRDPQIFAVGDVAGEPMLAHKAVHQARVAVEVILGRNVQFDKAAIPAVVFTDPEIAWAGLTQDGAKRSGREVAVAIYPWAASGRAQAIGRTEGLTKWVIDPGTQRILGCGIVGPGAGELISEAVLAIEMGCEIGDVAATIHPHPTLSETLMNAGEVHFGTATEIYKPLRRPATH